VGLKTVYAALAKMIEQGRASLAATIPNLPSNRVGQEQGLLRQGSFSSMAR
jgi:hypothetical protein